MSLLLFAILVVVAARGQDFGFNELHSVNCSHSHIRFMDLAVTILPLGSFRSCTKTKVLDLSNNNIEDITPGAFHGLNSLSELYLSNNKIREIMPGTFIPLTNLEVLDLSENLLFTWPQGEIRSKTLRYLNFYSNRLVNVPNYLLQHLKLTDLLDLSNNNLLQLDENALINVKGGGTINLSNNCLTSIAFNISAPYVKSTVFLASGNCIANITKGSLGTLHYLKIVDLDLSFNRIDSIESEAFDSYIHLKHLRLSHNKLVELPTKIFKNLPELTSIDLSHNRFTNTIFDLQYPNSIQYLNYSYNSITEIANYRWVPENSNVQELNVMHNKIKLLNASLVSQRIKSISLLYNDWKCSVLYSLWGDLEKRGIKMLGIMEVNVTSCRPKIKFHASTLKLAAKKVKGARKVKQQLAQNVTIEEEDTFSIIESKLNVFIYTFLFINLLLILPFFL